MAFDQSATAGDTLVAGSIHSPNFATGSSGWTINRDGSAEFQDVLVRGTITGSTIIGSTIVGGTIIAGDLRSSNYVAGTSGFDLNGNTNQIEINTGFRVGGATGQHITMGIISGATVIGFFTGIAGETAGAGIGVDTVVQGGITTPELNMESATMTNGVTIIALVPSTGTGAADFPGHISMGTIGTTVPTGQVVAGVMDIGNLNSVITDQWSVRINNEQGVTKPGPSLGQPALVLGNIATPQSRMLISVNELLSIDGTSAGETIYLNSNSGETFFSGVRAPSVRQQSTIYIGAAFTPGAGGYVSSGIGVGGQFCPSSGTCTYYLRFLVTGNTALTNADFVAGAINVQNTTQGTTPFAASDNRCAQVNGAFLSTGAVTVYTQITATGLGNPGDALTVTAQFRQNSNAAGRFFNISRVEIGTVPSL